jgi:hypothetical protein
MWFFGKKPKRKLRVFEGAPIELYEFADVEMEDGKKDTLKVIDRVIYPTPLVFETTTGKQRFYVVPADRYHIEYVQESWEFLFMNIKPFQPKIDYYTGTKEFRCGYCAGQLSGSADAIVRMLTVFKEPPYGARDRRIPLIQRYIYSISGQLECSQCGLQWLRKW